jgi:flagellar basal-body rod protein FlgG
VRAAGQGTTLTQRSLEASAVDLATAMTQLIEAQRSFQLASKAIETQDQLLGIANGIKR